MIRARGQAGARQRPGSRVALAAAALVLVIAAVACRPIPLGGPTNRIGNDVASCPQYQPAQSAPCGPQPMLWSAIQGPYESFANGDPYTTKCARDQAAPYNASTCGSGPYAGGATNSSYDPTGYEFAIDVKAADVGRSMAFQVWDAGTYPRTTGANSTTTSVVTMTSGSAILTRTGGSAFAAANVGKPIAGPGIAAGATITQFVSSSQIRISVAALSSGANRTVTVMTLSTADCNTSLPPFNSAPYNGAVGAQNCQTGDSGTAPFQVQIFENDGMDLSIDYGTPMSACNLYIAPGAGATTYKNKWATVCTFTPTMTGVFPVRIKSSAITLFDGTPVVDSGSGFNNFALRIQGATVTRLYAIGALSMWTNTPSSDARFYLAEITSADAGKRLQLDLFDPGDGNSGQYTIQVLAPPSGAPNIVPTSGSVIPAPGLADSCRYNPVASPTRGPDVAEPAGAPAPDCTVVTRDAGGSIYDNGWLSIEIDIAADYACTTDCWWTVRYDFGGAAGVPTDRTVWSPILIDKPAPAEPTTTSTTTTEVGPGAGAEASSA